MNQRSNTSRMPAMRLYLYLSMTFAMSWGAWWPLAIIAHHAGGVFGCPFTFALFLIGGFGPTLAALVAVARTPYENSFSEYASRLGRWRVRPIWWLAALAIPPAMAWLVEQVNIWSGQAAHADPLLPLLRLAEFFPLMIIGGGLEELGWRGVAQPELERRLTRVVATAAVGMFWAVWHLPLFFIPGVAQYNANFGFFALQIFGTAFITAWLYANTRSILLCVLFHAAANTATAMGLTASGSSSWSQLLGVVTRLAIGVGLVISLHPPTRPGSSYNS